jgi:hypothetical protein
VRALESRVVERLGEAEALRLDELLAAAAAAVAED